MKLKKRFFSGFRLVIWATFVLYGFIKLSTMQAGIAHLQGALATLALMVAIASLAYNRSRAYKDGSQEQVSSLIAGDLAIKAVVLFSFGLGMGAVLFLNLDEMGYQMTKGVPRDFVPILAAFFPIFFCGLAAFFFIDSLIALLTSLFPHWRFRDETGS